MVCLASSWDGRVVAALRADDHVDVWDVEAGRLVRSEPRPGARSLAVSSAVVVVGDAAGVHLAHAHGEAGWRPHLAPEVADVAVTPDGGNVVVLRGDGRLEVLRTLTGRVADAVLVDPRAASLTLIDAGRGWAVAGAGEVWWGQVRPAAVSGQRPGPPGARLRVWGRPAHGRASGCWGCWSDDGVWTADDDGWRAVAGPGARGVSARGAGPVVLDASGRLDGAVDGAWEHVAVAGDLLAVARGGHVEVIEG